MTPADGTGDAHGSASVETELAEALARCVAGAPDGIETILRLEGPRLLGVARRMLQRPDMAEEALQDAMLQIWRKAGQFRQGDGSARGWIFTVLRNRCRNILRDGSRLAHLSPEDLAALQDARQAIGWTDDRQFLPGSPRLQDCLAALDPAARHGILLAHVGGFTHGEIAAQLRVPLGTAKSWIRRGLQSLRDCLR